MKRILFPIIFALAACSYAQQQPAPPQLNGTKYQLGVYFGTYEGEGLGYVSLDTLGYLSDSVRRAISAGVYDQGGSNADSSILMFWRHVGDTASQFKFPNTNVLPLDYNGDGLKDYICWGANGVVTLLLGTQKIDSFVTAFTLNEGTGVFYHLPSYRHLNALTFDVNQDGYDDFILCEGGYSDSIGDPIGRLLYFKGGPTIDSFPAETLTGKSLSDFIGTGIITGKIRDSSTYYLIELRWYSAKYYSDTVTLALYPICSNFHLFPTDSVICRFTTGGSFSGGVILTKLYGDDTVDDILLGDTWGDVLVYRGGDSISPIPTDTIRRPFVTESATFGANIVNVGDITHRGYSVLAIADPSSSFDGYNNGSVFLYPIGRAYRDSCTAYMSGPQADMDAFGTQIIPMPDVDGSNNGFMIGSDEDVFGTGGSLSGAGAIYVFRGDTTLGPPVSVRQIPVIHSAISLSESYPNPTGNNAVVSFTTPPGVEALLMLYDILGKPVKELYHGSTGNGIVTINAVSLSAGVYVYRLTCGNSSVSRLLSVVH